MWTLFWKEYSTSRRAPRRPHSLYPSHFKVRCMWWHILRPASMLALQLQRRRRSRRRLLWCWSGVWQDAGSAGEGVRSAALLLADPSKVCSVELQQLAEVLAVSGEARPFTHPRIDVFAQAGAHAFFAESQLQALEAGAAAGKTVAAAAAGIPVGSRWSQWPTRWSPPCARP